MRKPEAEYPAKPQCHVRISRKIEIYLHREKEDGKKGICKISASAKAFIGLGWVIFASDKSVEGFSALTLIGVGAKGVASSGFLYDLLRNLPFMAIMTVGATPLPKRVYLKIKKRFASIDIILPLTAFLCSLAYIVGSGYDPFLYFRF